MTRRDFFTAYFLCKLHKTPYSGIQSCSEEQFVLRGHAPTPYQSGSFNALERKISKRGNSYLRKTGYEIMQSLIKHKPADDPVYDFIQKKRSEGKCGKESMIAGLNKFLRVYYGKVMEIHSEN